MRVSRLTPLIQGDILVPGAQIRRTESQMGFLVRIKAHVASMSVWGKTSNEGHRVDDIDRYRGSRDRH